MKSIMTIILEAQEKLECELHEVFTDLNIDYSLIEKGETVFDHDLKALNGTSYRFYHKGHGLITIIDNQHGHAGYNFDCSYQMKYADKTNAKVYFEASINEKREVYCIVIKKVCTCFETDKAKDEKIKRGFKDERFKLENKFILAKKSKNI